MGTNRRYAASIDRRAESSRELQLNILPLTTVPVPERVRVWVRFGRHPVLIQNAEAVMFTEAAVAVRFHADGVEYRCWVWSNAVSKIPPEPSRPPAEA